jgi:oxygen-dependent protoporphyrinogen oxidase
MGRIVEALASRLPAGAVRTGVRAEAVRRGDGSSFEVHTSSGVLTASAVVLACPAYEAARLLRDLDRPAATALDYLSYASCATVHLVYSGEHVRAPLRSFGFFVPRTEGSAILACSYVSEKFRERAPQGVVVFRAFVGGALRPDQIDAKDDALVAGAHDTLARVLGIASAPLRARIDRHVRAMPQYPPGSLERLSDAVAGVERHDGLFVTGGITGAIGIPDCVRVAEAVALRVAAYEAGRRGASAAGECVAYQANQKA